MSNFIKKLQKAAIQEVSLGNREALRILSDTSLDTKDIIAIASIPRQRYFKNYVQLHKINNLRNGYCQEDCNYCAQRNDKKAQAIERYIEKSEQEVLQEAKQAWDSGAYRYCLVSAGRGVNSKATERFASLIRKIKQNYPMQVCLSAGLLKNAKDAAILAKAGLDRYNHNLNTSKSHYKNICSTHTYEDRLDTLATLRVAGIELCSGLIVGLGEKPQDLIDVALELQRQKVASIPVNFFLPILKHAIVSPNTEQLTVDYCLRILCLFRILNPKAEIRLAAGRELYLNSHQMEALAIANSLFIEGYLNVQGEELHETITMLQKAGYEIESENTTIKASIHLAKESNRTKASKAGTTNASHNSQNTFSKEIHSTSLKTKSLKQLRPFLE